MDAIVQIFIESKQLNSFIRSQARKIARRRGFRKQDVEDIIQDLYLGVLERLNRCPPQHSNVEAFFVVVIKNHGSNLVRHRQAAKRNPASGKRPDRQEELLGNGDHSLSSHVYDNRRRHHPRPDDEHVQLRLDVGKVFGKLPPHLHALATLLKDLSLTKAAETLDTPRTTLQSGPLQELRSKFTKDGLHEYVINNFAD